jgi:hypothetical protein
MKQCFRRIGFDIDHVLGGKKRRDLRMDDGRPVVDQEDAAALPGLRRCAALGRLGPPSFSAGSATAFAPADLEAVYVRRHHVEQDDVALVALGYV